MCVLQVQHEETIEFVLQEEKTSLLCEFCVFVGENCIAEFNDLKLLKHFVHKHEQHAQKTSCISRGKDIIIVSVRICIFCFCL